MVGATSASLVHASPARMAGYNVYEIANDGAITALESYAYDETAGDFRPTALPEPGDVARAS